jgi:hypothetical protein
MLTGDPAGFNDFPFESPSNAGHRAGGFARRPTKYPTPCRKRQLISLHPTTPPYSEPRNDGYEWETHKSLERKHLGIQEFSALRWKTLAGNDWDAKLALLILNLNLNNGIELSERRSHQESENHVDVPSR